MLDRTIETALRRERMVAAASLALVVALAWIYLWRGAADMDAMSRVMDMSVPLAMEPDFALTFVMWAVMMVGMMLPGAAPTVLMYASAARQQRKGAAVLPAVWIFTSGYLAAWTLFSVAAAALQIILEQALLLTSMMVSANRALSASVLIAAGVYQVLPLKDACLGKCRNPLVLLTMRWRPGATGAFRMGLEHGLYCVGCCWLLMFVLFAAGVMNLLWVALIAMFVLAEKLLPWPRYTSCAASVALITAGLVVVLLP